SPATTSTWRIACRTGPHARPRRWNSSNRGRPPPRRPRRNADEAGGPIRFPFREPPAKDAVKSRSPESFGGWCRRCRGARRSAEEPVCRHTEQDDRQPDQGGYPGLDVDEHIAKQEERGGYVEQGGQRISQRAVRSGEIGASNSEHEDTGDGQHVEDVGA